MSKITRLCLFGFMLGILGAITFAILASLILWPGWEKESLILAAIAGVAAAPVSILISLPAAFILSSLSDRPRWIQLLLSCAAGAVVAIGVGYLFFPNDISNMSPFSQAIAINGLVVGVIAVYLLPLAANHSLQARRP